MQHEKLSQQYKHVLKQAYINALKSGDDEVTNRHVFMVLKSAKGSIAFELMHKLGLVSLAPVDSDGQDRVAGSCVNIKNINLSMETKAIIRHSVFIAASKGHRYVGTEHLLLSLVDYDKHLVIRLLGKDERSLRDLLYQLEAVMRNTGKFDDIISGFVSDDSDEGETVVPETAKKSGRLRRGQGSRERMLDYFSTDITDVDFQNKINPVIGREDEIERIIQILARRDKNNPVLIGEPGVGKTAIVEGLAKRIVEGDVPDVLLDKKIYNLDLSLLVAGAMYRGEFESRLKQLIDEIKEDQTIIVFIDELHTIVGAGSATGSLDAANILKPALARGEVRIIGATTFDEYKRYIEPDSALDRRLQSITVAEPTPEESVRILSGIKSTYEQHHGVKITDEAILSAVNLSHRYLSEKFLPDKAIDLIDEAAARIRVKKVPQKKYRELKKKEQELAKVIEMKNRAVEDENFPEALRFKEQERYLQQIIDDMSEPESFEFGGSVVVDDIVALVANMTGVPVGDLVSKEIKRIRNLEKHLSKHIVGQDEAIRSVAQAIKRSKTGLQSPGRPLSSFMFLGPSGVGKTEMAKVLAKEVFRDERALIRFDMSEFSEKFNVSRLLGAPAGYVGYKEGGQLTEAVRRRPYSVVLFDEIEKAHPEIFNILLQVLDEGFASDASGKKVDFRNTIVVLTSNLGLKEFTHVAKIGFDESLDRNTKERSSSERSYITNEVMKSIRQTFRPEFLNRLDHTIVFEPLKPTHVQKIVSIELKDIAKRLKEKGVELKVDKGVIKTIASNSFNPQEGARSVRRVIQDEILSPIADGLLEVGHVKDVKIGVALGVDDKISINIEK